VKKGEIVGSRKLGKNFTKERKLYSELSQEFLNILKIRGRSQQTITSYTYHNKYFMEFLGDKYCEDITLDTLDDYILYMRGVKEIKNGTTINSYLRNISPILKYAMKKGYILEDFLIPSVKEQETFKAIYTAEELDKLLSKPRKKDFTRYRSWAIIWVLSSTAIRARELRELKVKNLDLFNRTILLNFTKNKKARYVPVSESLEYVLIDYLEVRKGDGEDYLFPSVYNSQLAMSTLQKVMKNYCNERGIEKTSLHLFRHTFITNAVNKNVSPLILQRITGHSTMKELNRYYNAKTTDMVNVIDEIAPRSNKRKVILKKEGNYL